VVPQISICRVEIKYLQVKRAPMPTMPVQSFDPALETVTKLVADFKKNEKHYHSSTYSEAQARLDFIDKFLIALGWDVNHETQTNPYEQDVKVERGSKTGEGRRRADYAFLKSNFRDVRFYVEAKKPGPDIENADNYFQTIRYGWNSSTPLAVLTNFEQFHILDCRYKPDLSTALHRRHKKFHFSEYVDAQKFAEIYYLFSREAVLNGAIERYAEGLPKPSAKARQQSLFQTGGYQSVDESFLQKLDEYRDELARLFKNRNPQLGSEELTEVTQRTLDRLVFIRFLEDKLIEPELIVQNFDTNGSAWQNFIAASARLDRVYNGIIFKRHEILDSPSFRVDNNIFSGICDDLSSAESPYDFNSIPIHILGSIYERFLGKTIVATDKRARVEEKPEVRKAGGVYYTPEYIVRYIVAHTVGKLIKGKTPDEIRQMRFADIACGSGSFLLGTYDLLLRHNTAYYNKNKRTRAEGLKAKCRLHDDGTLHLSLWQRREVLLNNIYGVDIDAQAVEVAQLSLYLKMLEDETAASAKSHQLELREALLPSLSKNIIYGNSLIDLDILGGKLFDTDEEEKLNPMSFEGALPGIMRSGGFDAIVGNPPYIRIQTMQENAPLAVSYFRERYAAASKGNYDIYVVFVEKALQLLKAKGLLGYILPHKFFNAQYGEPLRRLIAGGKHLSHVVHFGDQQVFEGATTYTCLLILSKEQMESLSLIKVAELSAWRENGTGLMGEINNQNITEGEWNFTVGRGASLFEKLSRMPIKLENIAERMAQGIRTSANEVYVLDLVADKGDLVIAKSEQLGREVTLERNAVSLFLQGREIKPFQILPSGKAVIIPYQMSDGRPDLIAEAELKKRWPKTYSYLVENKTYLQNRERGKMKGADWYGYVYPKNLEVMRSSKILVPDIADRASFALDKDGTYTFTSGYGITFKASVKESPKYVLGLLNSKVLDFFLKSTSTPLRGGFFRYFTQFIKLLPIRTINFSDKADSARHDKLVQLVEQMMRTKPLLAAAQMDRERVSHEQRLAALDYKINQLVYELYDLTNEEIAVLEDAAEH
jgi:type I restriction-modification system DNA methylase subunit